MPALAKAGDVASVATAVKSKSPRVRLKKQPNSQKPVVNTMVVVVGLEFLTTWLVADKEDEKDVLPSRRFWINAAFLGFGLALLTDINAKMGKSMAYLVMAGAIFDRGEKIVTSFSKTEGLHLSGKEAKKHDEQRRARMLAESGKNAKLNAATIANQRQPIRIYTGTGGAAPAPNSSQYDGLNTPPKITPKNRRDPQGPLSGYVGKDSTSFLGQSGKG